MTLRPALVFVCDPQAQCPTWSFYRAGAGRGAPVRRYTIGAVGKIAPDKQEHGLRPSCARWLTATTRPGRKLPNAAYPPLLNSRINSWQSHATTGRQASFVARQPVNVSSRSAAANARRLGLADGAAMSLSSSTAVRKRSRRSPLNFSIPRAVLVPSGTTAAPVPRRRTYCRPLRVHDWLLGFELGAINCPWDRTD